MLPKIFWTTFTMSGEVITLNVGGTLFTTTMATLTKYPNSLLAAMFEPGSERPPARKDKEGNYFIDGEPKPFEMILRFLRRGKLTEDIDGCTLEQLELEADYYGLEELLKIIWARKKAEMKRQKAEEKKEKEEVKKRKNEEEEKEKKRPKMTTMEYKEKAIRLMDKAFDAKEKGRQDVAEFYAEFSVECREKAAELEALGYY